METSKMREILADLHTETQMADDYLEEITAFYYELENLLRDFNVGYNVILQKDENKDSKDFDLCFEDVPNPEAEGDYKYDASFWRIGYGKIGGGWHLLAQRYRHKFGGVRTATLERWGDPIRLTHAPKVVRIQASHYIEELLDCIRKAVKHNREVAACAEQKVVPLRSSLWDHVMPPAASVEEGFSPPR